MQIAELIFAGFLEEAASNFSGVVDDGSFQRFFRGYFDLSGNLIRQDI